MKVGFDTLVKEYVFCVRCKGTFVYQKKNLLICSSCGFRFYMNPRPCNAAVLVRKNGEILLVRRKYEPKKGLWDLPGGFVDINESAEESLSRELQEELGINLKTFTYLGSFYDTYLYKGATYPTLGIVFVGKLDTQKISSLDDVAEVKFFRKEDIPFDKIAFESIRHAIRLFLKRTL